ncbi:Assimilatory nitrite reductase [NAD(P)H] small subunit [compost metagenome]|uniref:3-phenylpropionate/trans-cinnamate dioxygenase ferredoxin subunit n=1 Tax=Pseudomonas jinjuensis TaxID=198616 RepID=A0A1H0LN16_9PSED|nr:Rieske 2Fe-2S domain-containing protein [Pseudomonas jinjuensis]SDO69381.1 3-phenylpropionate/trans-cinnamate dioxygenase ferredoxin subunit [Pseudomonas jinjuensis]
MKRLVEIPPDRLPEEGGRRLFRHEEKSVVLFLLDGVFYAIDDSCPHAGASLFCGKLEGRWLQCPAHGLRFNLADGCMASQRGFGVRRYPMESRDGAWFIDFTDIPRELVL